MRPTSIMPLGENLAEVLPVYYRRRRENTARKSGNIADWVERFGAATSPSSFSTATASCPARRSCRLAIAMDADPKAGLIQTVPRLVGGETLLQRLQQFACNTYGPAVAAGFAFWHRDQGNYWGHNAIIRTAAFASRGGASRSSGPQALRRPHHEPRLRRGGAVAASRLRRAHDAVARGVLRRHAAEHRRCRGARPALGAGQSAASGDRHAAGSDADGAVAPRHGRDVLSDLGGLGVVAGRRRRPGLAGPAVDPELFPRCKTLFPIWPIIDPGAALRLFLATLVVVLLPKGSGPRPGVEAGEAASTI